MDTQDDGLEKVTPFKKIHFWYLCWISRVYPFWYQSPFLEFVPVMYCFGSMEPTSFLDTNFCTSKHLLFWNSPIATCIFHEFCCSTILNQFQVVMVPGFRQKLWTHVPISVIHCPNVQKQEINTKFKKKIKPIHPPKFNREFTPESHGPTGRRSGFLLGFGNCSGAIFVKLRGYSILPFSSSSLHL